VILAVPILAVGLWAVYILQDLLTFQAQFIDWQSARKASKYDDWTSYLRLLLDTFLNYGVKGSGILGGISTGLLILLGLKSLSSNEQKHAYLLIVFLALASSLAVNYGREMAYPPLRLPAFYLTLFLCLAPFCAASLFPKLADIRNRLFHLDCSPVVVLFLLLLIAHSAWSSLVLVNEVHNSERALAYDPTTLAATIISNTERGSSLAIRVFPDCYDILLHSGHLRTVRKLSWHRLQREELLHYFGSNDYLAITDSVLEPRRPGHLIDLSDPMRGGQQYYQIAESLLSLEKVITLPGGGTTRLYKRDHNKSIESAE
jgi:hypothetical protein